MGRGAVGAGDVPWCSASDLAEYAYCPRAHFYRHHPPPSGVAPDALRSQEEGRSYHAHRARRMESRDRHVGRWIGLAMLALALLALAVYLGVGR